MESAHRPVLLKECIEGLNIRPDGIYVDGTLGWAGHSREIAARLTTGRLIGIDRDQEALRGASEQLKEYGEKVILVHDTFGNLPSILERHSVREADGMLFDLGVSSPQLDEGDRGFSYLRDAPLDMRMDQSSPLTAELVVNEWSREELSRILWEYGEERYAGRISESIVREREKAPIRTTGQLAEVIRKAMPGKALQEKQHPARRSFQAIRIAVNDELGEVKRMLDGVLPRLRPGGRVAVISFHSLEDRLVKTAFAEWARGCTCPPDFPVCVCGKTPQVRLIGKRPILPDEEEVRENPRARSAKLRIAEKL